jgi:hypothetical protein
VTLLEFEEQFRRRTRSSRENPKRQPSKDTPLTSYMSAQITARLLF